LAGDWYILDKGEPKPVDDMMEWARWMEENHMARHVGDDVIGGARVSTVFLGLDHSHGFGPPLIFETMVFGGPLDQEQDRYTTTQQAIDGHAAMCARVRDMAKLTGPNE
jgi:hypothetical protein